MAREFKQVFDSVPTSTQWTLGLTTTELGTARPRRDAFTAWANRSESLPQRKENGYIQWACCILSCRSSWHRLSMARSFFEILDVGDFDDHGDFLYSRPLWRQVSTCLLGQSPWCARRWCPSARSTPIPLLPVPMADRRGYCRVAATWPL